MNVFIVAGANLRFMPYIHGYLEQLISLDYGITLIYWDRDGQKDIILSDDIEVIKFSNYMKNDISKRLKIKFFMQYRNQIIKILRSREFDKIIVFDTQFAVLLSDLLVKKYKKRYIFDYRDPSYEKYKIYKKVLSSIVNNSIVTFISSNAYKKYLPECTNIYVVHNMIMKDLRYRNIRRELNRKAKKIRISFWGCIRDYEINILLIKAIGNDNRFELHYYGTYEKTAMLIEAYCKYNNIDNVFMHGDYLPDEKYNFIRNTDIIHNMYNNIDGSNPSMGNKYYDGVIFYLPQICTKNGYMGYEVNKNGIGIEVDPYKPFADTLYSYYDSIDWENFYIKCDDCLNRILLESESSTNHLIEALTRG